MNGPFKGLKGIVVDPSSVKSLKGTVVNPWSVKGLKDIVVNQGGSSLNGRSLEIVLTVPLTRTGKISETPKIL